MTVNKKRKGEKPTEPVVVADVVTETTERIEVIEEVTPNEPKSEDPLTEFKEKMTEEEKNPVFNMPPKKNYMWPILFIFIIAVLLLGGIFIYKQGVNKNGKINVVTLSPTPASAPTPTKTEVDLSKYEIKILNGSGIDGEAGRQKANLETEGFTVSSIGNADNSEYAETVVQAKEIVGLDFLDKLKGTLEASFKIGEQEDLADDADSDVVIIIGSSKN